jgi:hypothetical protein
MSKKKKRKEVIVRNNIHLDQHDYLDKVLERFSMTNAKSAPTPLPSN